VVDVLVQIKCRQDQNAGPASRQRSEIPGGFDPVHDRHTDIHQHHVGTALAAYPHCLGTLGGGAGDREVGLGAEEPGETSPNELVVVSDNDPDLPLKAGGRRARLQGRLGVHRPAPSLLGSVASTRNPPPGAGPVCSSPPTAAARSRMPSRPWPPAGGQCGGPGPLSRTRTRRSPFPNVSSTSTAVPGAWRRA